MTAWMGGFPYTSSSSSNYEPTIISKSTITIHTSKLEPRRRSPNSAFGYLQEVKVKRTYHFDPDHKRTTRSSNHTHKYTFKSPKTTPNPTTPITELNRFFQREWKCIKRGRWAQSRIAEFSPLLIFGSVFVLGMFLDRRYRRKIERKRAAEKEGEAWGDGFQGDSN